MIVIAALLASAAVLAALPAEPAQPGDPARAERQRPSVERLALAAGACLGIGLAIVIGGAAGLAIGAVAAASVMSAAPRLEQAQRDAAGRQAAAAVRREAPQVAGLLSALLASGATVPASVRACAGALRGPAALPMRRVAAALDLGAAPEEAWACATPGLESIGTALARSATSGAPAAALLDAVAADAARDARASAEAAARRAGVRAIVPLVACFLPAFLLVGVAPVVVSVAGAVLR